MNENATGLRLEFPMQSKLMSMPVYTYYMMIGSLTLSIQQENVPNWFHRKMQTLILGIKWKKI